MEIISLNNLIELFSKITHTDKLLVTYKALSEKPFAKETKFLNQYQAANELVKTLSKKLSTFLKGYSRSLCGDLNDENARKLVWVDLTPLYRPVIS